MVPPLPASVPHRIPDPGVFPLADKEIPPTLSAFCTVPPVARGLVAILAPSNEYAVTGILCVQRKIKSFVGPLQ